MIRSAFCFAAFAVALQAAGSNAQATSGAEPQLPVGQAAGQHNDEPAPTPLDPNRMIKRTVTIGNRTIVVDQLAGS